MSMMRSHSNRGEGMGVNVTSYPNGRVFTRYTSTGFHGEFVPDLNDRKVKKAPGGGHESSCVGASAESGSRVAQAAE